MSILMEDPHGSHYASVGREGLLREILTLTVELNSYRFESGSERDKIRKEVARDCVNICRLNGARATSQQIGERYGLTDAVLVAAREGRK